MALFRPSSVQDGRLLFHMYSRGIFTESKPKESSITVLLAAVTFCSEKCKATLIRVLHTASLTSTWDRCRTKSDGRRPRNCDTEEEGSTHSVTYKITIRMLLNHNCPSVRPPVWNNSTHAGRVIMKFCS
jgi:hypothetical protein